MDGKVPGKTKEQGSPLRDFQEISIEPAARYWKGDQRAFSENGDIRKKPATARWRNNLVCKINLLFIRTGSSCINSIRAFLTQNQCV